MSDITGTIFPMYDKTGNFRRFPETVIEAVLGLPSYLQTQFSSLANIYMPIEGIHEAKTWQEFVYRATPNTIKANLLNLDKIYGKSLAWNQLVENGDFSNGINGWSGTAQISAANNILTVVSNSASNNNVGRLFGATIGHILYFACEYISNKSFSIQNSLGPHDGIAESATFRRYSEVGTVPDSAYATDGVWFYNYIALSAGEWSAQFKNVIEVDLTLLYGSEIDGMTDADILAKFERDFPELYYPYDSGRLINNDAESMECVGRNVWDEEWENGTIDANGQKIPDQSAIRSKNYIPVLPSTEYYFRTPESYTSWLGVAFYDADKVFISGSGSPAIFTTPSNAAYMLINLSSDYGPTYNYDICINLSDTSFNGQYEPFWKKDLHLGLGNFKVKSPNIWDEEWEAGQFSTSTGEKIQDGSTDIRCKNPIKVVAGQKYYCTYIGRNTADILYLFYDAQMTYLHSYGYFGNTEITAPSNAAYMTVYFLGPSYTNNITINKSDPAFNGRYFSHEDITITGGLKGNGGWSDMIVGNKYVKRCEASVGTDWVAHNVSEYGYKSYRKALTGWNGSSAASINSFGILNYGSFDSSTANAEIIQFGLSGSDNTYICIAPSRDISDLVFLYGLQYPETYELVTPIATSLRAGTTEARISPNSYGLSAPMCCDMTYSVVQDASSAGDAQYSVTAGKLLNTHKIWGQDFNGEGDVTGAMSGVTTIAASGNITTAAQLVSTVAQGTAPLSVVSKTPVTNLCAEFASKLETTRTIWGRDFNGSANVSGALTGVTTINMSDTLTLAGSTDATRRIYFGDSNHYLELKDIGTPGTPNLVFHFSDGVFSDGFMSAFGTSGSVSPAVPSPLLIDCDTWNSGRTIGYIITSVLSNAISKYLDGYTIIITDVDTDISYTVLGTDGDMELYLSGGKTITSSE